MSTDFVKGCTRILVLNPNSSYQMTMGLARAIKDMELSQSVAIHTYTAPSESPLSINDSADLEKSTDVVLHDLRTTSLLGGFDAVLVACFSVHPLVSVLQMNYRFPADISVTGIFEASILTCLSLLQPGEQWGIVTTGKFWEEHLTRGVNTFLGVQPGSANAKFAGVESTGLNASDFHGGVEPDIIREKMGQATRRLLRKGNISCVVMGCAGMAGLEDIIRSAASEEYDVPRACELRIVDGVRAGIGLLEQMTRNKRAFKQKND
ncbi:Asp/Glu/hydantoin racemase [Chaetomium strumarium]|uniref:Asp/Glu/hydantoin racemase n=1 Tax=Chaetomium strumarium TaxID=1170767 RepID=A0AAJ0GX67_9PEZI|nr:Asp/Glu/hydantoin racemase [Chaetomium strumarium]